MNLRVDHKKRIELVKMLEDKGYKKLDPYLVFEISDFNEEYEKKLNNTVDLADVNPCKGCGQNCNDKSSYPMCENCIMG